MDSQMVCVSARPKLHIMSEIEAVFDSGPKGTIRTKLDQVLGKEKRKSEVKADHITEPESNNEMQLLRWVVCSSKCHRVFISHGISAYQQ